MRRDAPTDTRVLVVRERSVTLEAWPLDAVTVAADAAAATLCWPDGRRVLLGADGAVVDVEPTVWVDGPEIVRHVDTAWPSDVRLDRPARRAEEVPRPVFDTQGKDALLPVSALPVFKVAVVLTAVFLLALAVELVVLGAGPVFGWTVLLGAIVVIAAWRAVSLVPGDPAAYDDMQRRAGGMR